MPKTNKIIDGKRYACVLSRGHGQTKTQAKSVADRYRARGYSARVVGTKYGHEVYIRKMKR